MLNGLFAMSEIALVTARKARMQKLVDEGDGARARPSSWARTRPGSCRRSRSASPRSACSTASSARPRWPRRWRLARVTRGDSDFGHYRRHRPGGGGTITYFSIVVGELVPKRIGQTHPETVARLVARPINWLAIADQALREAALPLHPRAAALLGVKQQPTPA
jgi:putative hemolysin